MSGLDLVALMDELFTVLETAGIGLNVPDDRGGVRAGPPSPYMELPELVYGEPGPGLDRIPDLGCTVIFGPANNAKVFKTALAYASPAGDYSIPAALLAHEWVAAGTVWVTRAEPSIENVQGNNPSIAYTFHLDITK